MAEVEEDMCWVRTQQGGAAGVGPGWRWFGVIEREVRMRQLMKQRGRDREAVEWKAREEDKRVCHCQERGVYGPTKHNKYKNGY